MDPSEDLAGEDGGSRQGDVDGDAAEEEVDEVEEVEVVKETPEDRYFRIVSERAQETVRRMPVTNRKQELEDLGGDSLQQHVASTFESSGIRDPSKRMFEVECAVRRQLQLLQEKKSRKKERMKDAMRGAHKLIAQVESHQKSPGNEEKKSVNLFQAVKEVIHDQVWTEVGSFKTRDQAVAFIMECQPFSFTPVLEPGDDPLPKFETSHEAVEHVLKLIPVPMSYVSSYAEFKRRLRIRLVDVEEAEDPVKKALTSSRSRRRASAQKVDLPVSRPDPKPWLVEAAGSFFESPTTLRNIREDRRYFIAVAQDVAQNVLQEGYKVKLRFSIPCSGTPGEALAAWSKNEQRSGRKQGMKATVLPVVVPPEIDVVTHREKGFLIRCQELPASCFRPKKAGAAGTTGGDS